MAAGGLPHALADANGRQVLAMYHLLYLLFGIVVAAWAAAALANCATIILALERLAHGAGLPCMYTLLCG